MSKGSKRRPSSISEKEMEENWRRTFGGGMKQGMVQEEIVGQTAAERLTRYVEQLRREGKLGTPMGKKPLLIPHTENDTAA
jgi:hypothetical protein